MNHKMHTRARARPPFRPRLLCGLILGLPWAALAQNASPATLAQVVVTATTQPVDVADAPAAVTVIGRDEIETRNISRPADALKTVPSLYTGPQADGQINRSSGGTGAVTLRGIPGARTLVLLDGQSLLGANSGSINWRAINVDELERIEVVPGPFSSLYGSGAIGGVINMISKQPDRQEFIARWKRGYADAAGDDLGLFYRDKMSNGLGLQISASQMKRDDYVNEAVLAAPSAGAAGTPVSGAQATQTPTGGNTYQVGTKGRSPWRQDNVGARLSYDLDARSRLHASVAQSEFSESRQPYKSWLRDGNGNTVSSGTLNINGQRVVLQESAFVNSRSAQTSQRYEVGYDGMLGSERKLKLQLARISDDPSSQVITSGQPVATGAGRLTLTPSETTDLLAQFSEGLGDTAFLVYGLAVREAEVEQRHWGLSNWNDKGTRTTLNEGYDGRSTTTSLYAQIEWQLMDPFTIYLGGRYDQWRTSGSYFKNTAPTVDADYAEREESAFSPKLSGVYKLDPSLSLRASIGQSFLAPGNLDLYSRSFHGPNTFLNDPDLQPERGTTWEVGSLWQATPELETGLSYYESRLSDMIILKQLSTFVRQYVNIGEAKVRGMEWTGKAQLMPGLRLDANYSWIDATTVDNDAEPASEGKRLPSVPKNMAYAGLSAERGGWSGTLDLRYTGKVYGNTNNSDTVEGVPGAYDAYYWANAMVGYQFSKRVRLNLGVTNLGDRKVYQSIQMPGRSWSTELVYAL
ncbi:TonB-dependent receptor [Hylemonella sp. W303a]|uniref:TonB-dependent receptor n=1 Tax=Hylemonella sp. W303a TaxID=3389873 RepID=UPI00396B0355